MHIYPSASAVVRDLSPDEPVILNRPHAAARAARFFAKRFPGKSLYAVKANPSPELLKVLWDAGVTHFDVASIAEVRLVRGTLPTAELCFMHPVKTAKAIREAYFEHGVKTFSLDTIEELEKIVAATADHAIVDRARQRENIVAVGPDEALDPEIAIAIRRAAMPLAGHVSAAKEARPAVIDDGDPTGFSGVGHRVVHRPWIVILLAEEAVGERCPG